MWVERVVFPFSYCLTLHAWFQDQTVQPLAEQDSKTLQQLIPEIPSWIKNPDYDRVGYYMEN